MEKKVRIELSLDELNVLYYAISKQKVEADYEVKQYGGEFFERQANITSNLVDKISNKLYNLAHNGN